MATNTTAIVFGVFGTAGALVVFYDKLKEIWQQFTNMKWNKIFGSSRISWLQKHHRIQNSDTFEITKMILQTTTLARLRDTDLKILTNVVKYLTSSVRSRAREENGVYVDETRFSLRFICLSVLGEMNVFLSKPLTDSSCIESWAVIAALLSCVRDARMDGVDKELYERTLEHMRRICECTSNLLILEPCGRLMLALLQEDIIENTGAIDDEYIKVAPFTDLVAERICLINTNAFHGHSLIEIMSLSQHVKK